MVRISLVMLGIEGAGDPKELLDSVQEGTISARQQVHITVMKLQL